MSWKVRLDGSDEYLPYLEMGFDDDPEIYEEDGQYFMQCSEFEALSDHNEVRSEAERILTTIESFGEREDILFDNLRVDGTYDMRDNSQVDMIHYSEPAQMLVSGHPVIITTTDAEGEEETHSPAADKTDQWTRLAREDEKVAELVGLLDVGDSWTDLYRTYEFIQSNIHGDENIVAREWWSQDEKETFKRTANSREAIGDAARHGDDTATAPDDPMELSEAQRLIDGLIDNWLEYREQRID